MREYTYTIMRPGCHFEFWPSRYVTAPKARIRLVAAILFRRWFGRAPDDHRRSWHKDGFMAEVACRRGFVLQIEQINRPREQHVTPPRYRDRTALALTPFTPATAGKERAA